MTTTLSMEDFVRNINYLQQYDYVDVADKKTDEYKGLFVSSKYADELRELLVAKVKESK
jgi:hypothetical protein